MKLFHCALSETSWHEIPFRAKWNIFILVSGQFFITVYMMQPEMKLVADVILLWSFWKKWNFISGDKISCKRYPKWNHMKRNICACVYFIKKKKVIGFYWIGRFSWTTPETKSQFFSPAKKSNVNRISFMVG